MVIARARWTLVAAAAAGSVGELVRRRRSARSVPPPPVTTQSSPGQIADLQQTYGAEMAPPAAPAPGEDARAR
jgi:hypothetical protein